MDNDNGQAIYLKNYIQKQELMLLDYLRKSVDSEIRASMLEASIKDLTEKYNESQKQVEIQNDMMSQAAKGLETVTVERNQLQDRVDEYLKTITSLQQEKDTFYQELVKVRENFDGSDRRINELTAELKKQNEELTALYHENESLKKKLPKPPPELNKKNKKESATLPPDEF